MKKSSALVLAIIILGAAAGIYVLWHKAVVNREVAAAQAKDEAAITEVVKAFGEKMKNVPLLAPKAAADKAIQENYSQFVSSEILATWKADPMKAPGRLTSSPWPKGIDIITITPKPDGSYEVQGKVMAVTSADLGPQGVPLTEGTLDFLVALLFRNENGRWVITGFEKAVPRA